MPLSRYLNPVFAFLTMSVMFGVFSAAQDLTPAEVKALPECSLAKTNESCRLSIDRGNPVTPPAIQLYSDKTFVVVVKNPKPYERYFLDYQTNVATLTPDVASSIVQGLLSPLSKLTFRAEVRGPGVVAPPDPCSVPEVTQDPTKDDLKKPDYLEKKVVPAFQKCLGKLATDAIAIYRQFEPSIAPDSQTPYGSPIDADLDAIRDAISKFLQSEFAVSGRINAISNISAIKNNPPDAPALVQLADMQKMVDAVAADLMAYSQRITDLDDLDYVAVPCDKVTDLSKDEQDAAPDCVYLNSRTDSSKVYHGMVSRAVTYSLDTLNLITNSQQAAVDPSKKKLLATISLTFADYKPAWSGKSLRSAYRWEASAGTFFSWLPVRSFAAAPVFTNGVITDKTVSQSVLHPTVVPFAAANYRLSKDLGWSRWKSAVYWTGAVGINPNTVSADFATGPSFSWRALMVSAFCHFGHDTKLTQGLSVGESLGAGFSGNLSTKTYWTESFAIGVSVRIPALTGR